MITSANNFAGSSGTSVAYPNANVAGNFLVCTFRGHATSTVSDSNNNTGWTRAVSIANGGEGQNIWYCASCKAGANTVSTSEGQALCIGEYNGVATLGPTSSNTGSGNPYSSAAVVASQAALIVGAVSNESANGRTDMPTGGFNDEANGNGNEFYADQIGAAGSYSYGGSYSSGVNWATTVAIFYASSSGGASYDSTKPFLGSVRVVTQAPSGAPTIYVGTVIKLGSTPAGLSNPYLGNAIAGTPTSNDGNPALGQVVEVASAPAGDSDPFLGEMEGL